MLPIFLRDSSSPFGGRPFVSSLTLPSPTPRVSLHCFAAAGRASRIDRFYVCLQPQGLPQAQ
eukprot:5871314-Lingulodinium_polyedra.AAC.1